MAQSIWLGRFGYDRRQSHADSGLRAGAVRVLDDHPFDASSGETLKPFDRDSRVRGLLAQHDRRGHPGQELLENDSALTQATAPQVLARSRQDIERPSDLKERQGSAYTWGILMDPRVRDLE